MHPADLDYLFRQAEQALASLESDQAGNLPPGLSPFEFTEFSGAPPSTQAATLDLLKEVELDVQIELGRTRLYLEDVLRLRKGAVVTLDKLAGDPVDIYVNGRLIARGEVLVLNDNFCIRVAELVAGKQPQIDAES
ncbi:MAG: flagellar motor switch protein FliN [Thermogutta sp.]|nr:flagellar motor switch protein FliN [Thermogutta sp.]